MPEISAGHPTTITKEFIVEQSKEKVTGNEIVVSVDFSETEKALIEAEHRFKDVVHDVTTTRGLKAAKADIGELRTMRTTTDKKRLEAGRVLLAEKAKIDDQAKAIIGRITALEEPLKLQVEAEEARKEAERLAELEKERVRVETITAKINDFRELTGKVAGWPSGRIQAELSRISELHIFDDEYQEYTAQAIDAHDACVARLSQMLADAQGREAEAERVRKLEEQAKAQQEELERLREQAAQAEVQRQREQAQREAEAAEHERQAQAAETLRKANIQARIQEISMIATSDWRIGTEALKDRLDELEVLDPALGNFLFDEFGRQASVTYTAAHDSITGAIAEAERQEAIAAKDRAEQQSRAEEAEQQRQDALNKARESEEAAAKAKAAAEAMRLASLDLRTAAKALADWCVSRGLGGEQVVKDVVAVLDGERPVEKAGKRQATPATRVPRGG